MRAVTRLLIFALAVALASSASAVVKVKGYYRKDGTYVRPYTRGGSAASKSSTSSRASRSGISASSYGTSTSIPAGDSEGEVRTVPMSYSDYVRSTSTDKKSAVSTEQTEGSEQLEDTETKWTYERLAQIDAAIVSYQERNDGRLPDTFRTLIRSSGVVLPSIDGWLSGIHYSTNALGYVLISRGRDKKLGTSDDIISDGSTGLRRQE